MDIGHWTGRGRGLWTLGSVRGHVFHSWALGCVHSIGLPLVLTKVLGPCVAQSPLWTRRCPPLIIVTIVVAMLVATTGSTVVTAAIADADKQCNSLACLPTAAPGKMTNYSTQTMTHNTPT